MTNPNTPVEWRETFEDCPYIVLEASDPLGDFSVTSIETETLFQAFKARLIEELNLEVGK